MPLRLRADSREPIVPGCCANGSALGRSSSKPSNPCGVHAFLPENELRVSLPTLALCPGCISDSSCPEHDVGSPSASRTLLNCPPVSSVRKLCSDDAGVVIACSTARFSQRSSSLKPTDLNNQGTANQSHRTTTTSADAVRFFHKC